jgi:hypothetical protein
MRALDAELMDAPRRKGGVRAQQGCHGIPEGWAFNACRSMTGTARRCMTDTGGQMTAPIGWS